MNYLSLLLALMSFSCAARADMASERAKLVQGVTKLVAPGCLPGPIAVYGPNAFVILTGRSGADYSPLFGATSILRGRAIAGGHEGFFSDQALSDPNNARFLTNCIAWLARGPIGKARVGLLDMGGMKKTLDLAGASVAIVNVRDIPRDLGKFNVLCLNQAVLDRMVDRQKAVSAFLRSGGGLLIAGPAWGWIMGAGDKDLVKDHTGNALLRPYGLAFPNGFVGEPYSPQGAENPLLHADQAMEGLKLGGLTPKESSLALKTVETLITILPSDDKTYLPRIRALAARDKTPIVPTISAPITSAMPLARLNAVLFARSMHGARAGAGSAHPAAQEFPGPVPSVASRVSKTISIDTAVPNWNGTGLYAAPGERIEVSVPESAVSEGLSVRIGSHTDTLWGSEKWRRFPEISLSFTLKAVKTVVANPFGGTIFIDVPERCRLGVIGVTVSNAVEQPRFVRGQTSPEEWRRTIRTNPAPWAEMEGKLVILSVPSSAVRDVDDPEALMAYWDSVVEACHKLYAAPERPRPERYCVDRQISIGYMHSGYPIMTHEDVAATFCDLGKLSVKGGHLWGFYHEMGHDFQRGEWTFEGTGEVTNNLFSIYGQESVVGLKVEEYGLAHPGLKEPEATERLKKYLASGARFTDWQNDPFLALTMYVQVRKAFGWDVLTRAVASYDTGPQPRNDDERRNQWMVRLSRAAGRNLGPFFTAWGVPTSESARQSITDLPGWMPEGFPKP